MTDTPTIATPVVETEEVTEETARFASVLTFVKTAPRKVKRAAVNGGSATWRFAKDGAKTAFKPEVGMTIAAYAFAALLMFAVWSLAVWLFTVMPVVGIILMAFLGLNLLWTLANMARISNFMQEFGLES